MYYNVMTTTVMVVFHSYSLKEKQDDGYGQSKVQGRTKCAYRKGKKDVLTRRLEYRHRTGQNTIPW
jgi:hypothetical protein